MKLKQLLPILENCNRIDLVDDETLDIVSMYDGKNHLKKIYNVCEVTYISAVEPGHIRVYIIIE